MWTSLDVGIKFEKSNNITAQLARIRNGGLPMKTAKELDEVARRGSAQDGDEAKSPVDKGGDNHPPTADDVFSKLNSFYKQQLEDSAETGVYGTTAGDLNYASPSSINRLLNMYSTGKRIKSRKPKPMRSAYHPNEGLHVFDPSSGHATTQRLLDQGWDTTANLEQLSLQEPRNSSATRFTSDLRPVATLLRTKRSKRCKTCRTLLSRPEPKVSTTRYKIRVLASTNLPSLSLRSLTSPPTSSTTHPLFALPKDTRNLPYTSLKSLSPHQFILTITNPLFDNIRVLLATPATTPGGVPTKVTLLCPSFEVGANTDVWDEALNSSASAMAKRRSVMPGASGAIPEEGGRQPEVGKVWERGRNWTSVVMEVVPGMLPGSTGSSLTAAVETANARNQRGDGDSSDDEESEDSDGAEGDAAVIEIPVFVRVNYETEAGGAGATEERREGAAKESREVEFWSVLGVGKIAA
jgi:dynactin-4